MDKIQPTSKLHSAKAWMLVHVFFPLLPFVIEGCLRCLILGWRLDSFSGATLSASMALICFFIYQSLIAHRYPIPNDQEEEQHVSWAATLFLIFAMVSTALFTGIVLLSAVVEVEVSKMFQTRLCTLQVITFIFCLIPISVAFKIPESFNLRATF